MQFPAKPFATLLCCCVVAASAWISGSVSTRSGAPLAGVSVRQLSSDATDSTDLDGRWSIGTPPVRSEGKRGSIRATHRGGFVHLDLPVPGWVTITAFGTDGRTRFEATHQGQAGPNAIPLPRGARQVGHLQVRANGSVTTLPWTSFGSSEQSVRSQGTPALRRASLDSIEFTKPGYRRVVRTPSPGQDTLLVTMDSLDADEDSIPDLIDNCVNAPNPNQGDFDWDGIGDACDDSDRDGILDSSDTCPLDPTDACSPSMDQDGDGITDGNDNCPRTFNPVLDGGAQDDSDQDGIGDRCDEDDPSLLIDRRGGSNGKFTAYRTTTIGKQVWMAENLAHPMPADGSRCYRDSTSFCMAYGLLYPWSAAQVACPEGWHLPSPAEWDTLVAFVGEDSAGTRLRTTYGWPEGWNGSDVFSFSAYPTGTRWSSQGGTPVDTMAGSVSRFWSTGIEPRGEGVVAISRILSVLTSPSMRTTLFAARTDTTGHAYSVRCIKD